MTNYIRLCGIAVFAISLMNADGILEHTTIAVSHSREKSLRVKKLSPGSYVMSFHPETFQPFELTKVNHIVRQTVDYVVHVHFADTTEVVVSPYQKMLLADSKKWIDARKLHVGDQLMLRDHRTIVIHAIEHEKVNPQSVTHVLIMSPGDHILAITPQGILTKHSDKVVELQELFQRKDERFAAALANTAAITPWKHKSAQIYVVTEDLPEYGLRKGNLMYLDKLHFDHLEVFNEQGTDEVTVLNLDGTKNVLKTQLAHDEHRTITQYMHSTVSGG
jgi:hypothetical protein